VKVQGRKKERIGMFLAETTTGASSKRHKAKNTIRTTQPSVAENARHYLEQKQNMLIVYPMSNMNMNIQEIEIDNIVEPVAQVRSVMESEKLSELSRSISQIGLIEPLVVKKIGEKYEVIAGHRRLLACRMAGLAKINCIVRSNNAENEDEIKLHENFYRENVNPADEAEFYAYLINTKKNTTEEVAKKVGKSGAYIRSRLDLISGDNMILDAVRDGQINASVAKELNLIGDRETRLNYLHYAIDNGAKIRTVQEWRKQWEREQRTQEVLSQGHSHQELPDVLPKYYYRCPMCEQPVEVQKVRAVSVCGNCYKEIMKSFEKKEEEAPEK